MRVRSSWDEYIGKSRHNFCSKDIILGQFETINDYKDFAKSSLDEILRAKENKDDGEMLIGKYFF